jgi:hypothetical protein
MTIICKTANFTTNITKCFTELNLKNHFWKPIMVVVFLPVIMLSSCNLFTRENQPGQTNSQLSTPRPQEETPQALVTFHVQTPIETPLNEPVYLYILDEVTGLALNPKSYEMEAVDDHNHSLNLPFNVGAVIKYRYARQGSYIATEYTSKNQQVRYRLALVDGPSELFDVVSAWSDIPFNSPTGRIKGQVLISDNPTSVPGLLITAGGQHAFTASDGTFLIEGLPPGTHNLVVYAIDGAYKTFQQGAVVAQDSTTPAPIQVVSSPLVNIVFTLSVPMETMPAVPIRIAGNLYQLGNTFADLSGGMNTLASRMPILTPLPDGRYSTSIALPAGAYVEYKYTLGDGFWNSEHDPDGNFQLRQFVVPDKNTIIEDQVESWGSVEKGPIIFDIAVPISTPAEDYVSIQFNPYGWTESIPMWNLGDNHYAYILYSPLNVLERFGYRYCRNGQCGNADDILTIGNESYGRIVEIGEGSQTINENVGDWVWLDPNLSSANIILPPIAPRNSGFIAGIELQSFYHPSWTPLNPGSFEQISSLNANWITLSPTWTYTEIAPPILEPFPGNDMLWHDNVTTIKQAQEAGLNVGLKPTPNFLYSTDDWWINAPRDFAWWIVWFERYRQFALHHADLAQQSGAKKLILGGKWVEPALPNGLLPDGLPSGVPGDAETRWREIINEVKNHYQGKLVWEMPFTGESIEYLVFIDLFDEIQIDWSPQLSQNTSASEFELYSQTAIYLDQYILLITRQTGLPATISISYPSADGGITGCITNPLAVTEGDCLDIDLLSRPNPDIPTVLRDLDEQLMAYNATMTAINERDWINGVVARGYYPPAALQDKSSSINGKPAGELLRSWFSSFIELIEKN